MTGRDLLGKIAVPTLVLHCRDDALAPIVAGRHIAAGIPGARFVSLDSANHILQESEPAWAKFLAEVVRFLGEGRDSHRATPDEAEPRSGDFRRKGAGCRETPALRSATAGVAHDQVARGQYW